MGCSEGVFTLQLARRCRSVAAYDISPVACMRAAERCTAYPQVRVEKLNVIRDDIPGHYDVVFVMDLLEYIHGRTRMKEVVAKLANAVRDGGLFVFCGCRLPAAIRGKWLVRRLPEGGDSLVAFLSGGFGLRLAYQEMHPETGRNFPGYPDHVIALFEKKQPARSWPRDATD